MNVGDRVLFTDRCFGNEPHNGETGTVAIRELDGYTLRFDDGQTMWAMNKEVTAL